MSPAIITAVTVYPDRAGVTHRGSMAVKAGTHRLELPELPLQLDPDSVRASARSGGRARFLGVQVEHTFFVETPSQ